MIRSKYLKTYRAKLVILEATTRLSLVHVDPFSHGFLQRAFKQCQRTEQKCALCVAKTAVR